MDICCPGIFHCYLEDSDDGNIDCRASAVVTKIT